MTLAAGARGRRADGTGAPALAAGQAPRVLDAVPLRIDPAEVLRFQGYRAGGAAPGPEVDALLVDALAAGDALMAPRAVVRWLAVDAETDDTLAVGCEVAELTGGRPLALPGLGRRWGPIERVAVILCTIGDALERRVDELWTARELPRAAMLDSVGSAAVESLAEYVNDLLCQEALPEGLRVTNRVSPGWGDWDVELQRELFALCPGEPIGVTLNDSCFMAPVKSISFLVGAGAAARVDDYFPQCARCWMRTCAYRRVPARGSVRR